MVKLDTMNVAQAAQRAAQHLLVRSALNPVLWLSGITAPVFLASAYAFRDSAALCAVLVGVAALPVIVACAGFVGFAIAKPEKLQSESYQLRHESLQLIQQQKIGRIVVDTAAVEAIANPAQQLLAAEDSKP